MPYRLLSPEPVCGYHHLLRTKQHTQFAGTYTRTQKHAGSKKYTKEMSSHRKTFGKRHRNNARSNSESCSKAWPMVTFPAADRPIIYSDW